MWIYFGKPDKVHIRYKQSPVSRRRTESIGAYLEMPDIPQRKGKREVERIPFAITSRLYQESFEAKRALKLEEEYKTMERKNDKEKQTLQLN
ncbi:hypothetical protein NQ318_000628 [Aromia moschata]|uniref:Uncharacterized protein n=1 Tax=Aromia moschata TaxID=1265417 RepID=A0AAV8X9W6_9CUCU|nr:hypothetical protein NQ318_000628 [Aromia moschata]